MAEIPSFFGDAFISRGSGFFLGPDTPVDIAEPRHFGNSNPWFALACALARLQQGDFDVFPALADRLLHYDDLLFLLNAGTLFAHAAPLSEVELFRQAWPASKLETLPPQRTSDYCQVLCHTMSPRYLDEVLYWYRKRGHEGWVRVEVAWWLSHVWESSDGPLHEGPQLVPDPQYPPPFEQNMRDYDSYEALVRECSAKGNSARFWFRGEPFSVAGLAKYMLADARAGKDTTRTQYERMIFEANTGISCREWFADSDDAKLRPLEAVATLEDFLFDPRSEQFEADVRYFFGHRIPD